MYDRCKQMLFKLDAEKAHNVAEFFLRKIAPLPLVQDLMAWQFVRCDERLANTLDSVFFPNPVGLSAGFDKNATMLKGLSALGFGFLEVGTITQAPQSGNPKPRLFRFPQSQSLQNMMGFNNNGVIKIAKRLKKLYPFCLPIGANIGKNKIIVQSDSLQNYENTLLELLDLADYFVFNVSSPNTPKLRDLQNKTFIASLCKMARRHTDKPIFVKISPDMHTDDMLEVIESAIKHGCSGIIAANTSIDYSLLQGAKDQGGISGGALKERSREVFERIAKEFFGKTLLVSSGGIDNADEAYERIKMGASLVQIYTGLIYQGPSLPKCINEGILARMQADGFAHISEVIGANHATKSPKSSKDKETKLAEATEEKSMQAISIESTESNKPKARKSSTKTTSRAGRIGRDSKDSSKSKSLESRTISDDETNV